MFLVIIQITEINKIGFKHRTLSIFKILIPYFSVITQSYSYSFILYEQKLNEKIFCQASAIHME